MTGLLAAIPPPPFSEFQIGPLTIRMYGILIGLGVLAAVWLSGKLMEERGVGTTDDAGYITMWGVAAGVIGARAYHVITSWSLYKDNIGEAFKFWTPGLGIPGGILFGTLAGVWAAKRRGVPVLPTLSCAAPAIPLAQAIGRLGNYFNQELYGRPTNLPWGLRVDEAHIVGAARAEYPGADVFHPTMFYESLWNLGLCLALVWLFRNRPKLQPGRLFPLYLIGYGIGRLWIESLRIDPANKIGPFRVNIWMSLALIIGGAAWFIMTRDSTERWPRPARVGGSTTALDEGASSDASAAPSDRTADHDDRHNSHDDPGGHDDSHDHDTAGEDRAGDDTAGDDTAGAAAAAVDEAASVGEEFSDAATSNRATPSPATSNPTDGDKAEPIAAKKSTAATGTTRKRAAQKSTAKKSPAKKSPAKKSAAKKGTAKKGTAKKAPAPTKSAGADKATGASIDPGLSMGSDSAEQDD